MKHINIIFSAFLGLFVTVFIPLSIKAQVDGPIQFVIEKNSNDIVSVSLLPDVTWTGVSALTAAARVTIVVPTGGFQVGNLVSINGDWLDLPSTIAPMENPDFDYVNFDLQGLGTADIEYTAGEEILLFTFENTGTCVSSIQLMELNDPFTPPNSLNINVGNQITTFGSGNTNAWGGNIGSVNYDCGFVEVLGCTDVNACNFDPLANINDGTCLFGNDGCTDTAANNFDSNAACDNGSCIYIPNCGGLLVDSGGPNGDYGNNEQETIVVCPDVLGTTVSIDFYDFSTEGGFDELLIFDGPTTAANPILNPNGSPEWEGIPTGSASPIGQSPFVSTDPSGCLTFVWNSDATVTRPGWAATVECVSVACPENLTQSGLLNSPADYQASQTIISSQQVNGPNNLNYQAGSRITLENGFSIQPNATFNATIGDCDN